MTELEQHELHTLQMFVVELGAALNETGEPVYEVQERLTQAAHSYGAHDARISAFPTYMMVTMGRGEPATVELTGQLASSPRLDQISALHRLVADAERGAVPPADGLRALAGIRDMAPRFGPVQSVLGYSVFTTGVCLILHPAPRDIAAAAVLGALVGTLCALAKGRRQLQILLPVVAAVGVSALTALAVKQGWAAPGLRAVVASLITFVPGAALGTAVLELAAGQMMSGSSRLVSGAVQLAMLSFGILVGIELVGTSSTEVFAGSANVLGDWAPWLGVTVFAAGVTVVYSAPARSFVGLLVVLYAAWVGQVAGNAVLGPYVSAFVGAAIMTPVTFWVARLPAGMPPHAAFIPGFWLLVPGALGLVGLTQVAGDADVSGTNDLVATVVSIFAVALGVLVGTLLHTSMSGAMSGVSGALARRRERRSR